jgi:plasmid maintenance system antidote protein VapI
MALSLSEILRKAIKSYASLSALSQASRVAEADLSRFARGNGTITLAMAERIAATLGIVAMTPANFNAYIADAEKRGERRENDYWSRRWAKRLKEESSGAASSAAVRQALSEWYREAAKKHHPDHGGSAKAMAIVNECRDQLQDMIDKLSDGNEINKPSDDDDIPF